MNKNTILVSGVLVAIGVLGIAQSGNPELITGMMGYKMAGSHKSSFILGLVALKLLALAVVSFIFSAVFWYTHKWVMKKK